LTLEGVTFTNYSPNTSSSDAFVAKYSKRGELVWARQAGGTGYDRGAGIAVDSTGSSFVAGTFTGKATFGSRTMTSSGASDIFLAKYDGDGNLLWAQQAGGKSYDWASSVALDSAGDCYVAGEFATNATFGSKSLTSNGPSDGFVAKYASSGSVVWVAKIGGNSGDTCSHVASVPGGGVLAAGTFRGAANFGTRSLTSRGSDDIFLAKYDGTGNFLWAQQVGSANSSGEMSMYVDLARGLAVDRNSQCYLAAQVQLNVIGPWESTVSFGTQELPITRELPSFLAAYDSAGQLLWAKVGKYWAWGSALVAHPDGGCCAASTDEVAIYGPEGELVHRWFIGTRSPVIYSVAMGTGRKGCATGDFQGRRIVNSTLLLASGRNCFFLSNFGVGPPLITREDFAFRSAAIGEVTTFSVSVDGEHPLSFQWFFDRTNLIEGATNSSLALPCLSTNQSGCYSVMASNRLGTSVSAPSFLQVVKLGAPIVTVGGSKAFGPFQDLDSVTVALDSAFTNATVFYTLDGSVADFNSTPYEGPFRLFQSAIVRAIAYDRNFQAAESGPQPITLTITPPLITVNKQIGTSFSFTNVDSVSVQIAAGLGAAEIHYTLDGSQPTVEGGLYSGAFLITNSVVVRAIAYSTNLGMADSGPVRIDVWRTYRLSAGTVGGGTILKAPDAEVYRNDAVVHLTASPAPDWSFMRWAGDALGTNPVVAVTMEKPRVVEAIFGTKMATTVVGDGDIHLEPNLSVYPYGSVVRASAVPREGNSFALWGASVSGNGNPLLVVVTNGNPTIAALFAPLGSGRVALTVMPRGRGSVAVDPRANSYVKGQSVTITATPEGESEFLFWGGDAAGSQNPLTVTMDASRVITAYFSSCVPRFERPRWDVNEGMSVSLLTEPGTCCIVEVSTDLIRWIPWKTVTNELEVLDLTDEAQTSSRWRFYRALLP
jgi:hypothetical protein